MNRFSKQIFEKYQTEIKNKKNKVVLLWFYIMDIFAVLAGLTFIFYHRDEVFRILFFAFLAIFGFFFILVIILLLFFVSEKPLYEILYPKVIDDHNYEEITMMTYTPYPKDKDFIDFGGLYPTRSGIVLRFKISFENAQGFPVEIYDAYIVTSNGKTTNIHLNGYYLLFRDYSDLKFQFRTHGVPNVDPKYVKLADVTDVRAYVESSVLDLDPKYIRLYHLIKNEYHSPSVDIGCNGNDLHIGITLKPMRRHVKVLTEEVYQELRRSLMQMIDLANLIK